MTRSEIIITVRKYLNTPFRHQGRDPGKGLDCVGILICASKELGITDFDYKNYTMRPDTKVMMKYMSQFADRIPIKEAKAGDIYQLHFTDEPTHYAVITSDNTILHAYLRAGKCVEHSMNDHWKRRITYAWRLKGIDDG